jgi:hypothetical protein
MRSVSFILVNLIFPFIDATDHYYYNHNDIMSNTHTSAKTTTTVHFNVGGKIHEVSRSLIEKYPDSMLRTLVSKAWLNDEQKDPLFIDRDGERFRYCLDYMRYGEVALPITVSKDAILKDLDYYGFHNVDPNVFTFSITGGEAMNYINTLTEEKEMNVNFLNLAHYCFLRFKNSGRRDITFYVANDDYKDFHGRPGNIKFHEKKMDELRTIVCSLRGSDEENKITWTCFNTHLNGYGLRLKSLDFTTYPIAPCIEIETF